MWERGIGKPDRHNSKKQERPQLRLMETVAS
jgi:hypothetical protein